MKDKPALGQQLFKNPILGLLIHRENVNMPCKITNVYLTASFRVAASISLHRLNSGSAVLSCNVIS